MTNHQIDEAEVRRIMTAGLGRAELEFATSVCTPLFWVMREENGSVRVRNGTAFFLDAGEEVFAVTAAHVLTGLEEDRLAHTVLAVQLGDLAVDFNGAHAVIDRSEQLDIATFRITAAEVAAIGKTVLIGSQAAWPPAPPQQGRGVYFSGFAGADTLWHSEDEISFAAAPGSGVADMVGRRDIGTVFNRENWIDVMGLGLPPERYNFGGISGGPMLSVIERHGIRSWALAGVIYEGPNPSTDEGHAIAGFETIRARRAHFIRPDGRLDLDLWDA
ncbi:MAG: hypothetical protein WBK77_04165 [Alphaproteobacteria bacterium]